MEGLGPVRHCPSNLARLSDTEDTQLQPERSRDGALTPVTGRARPLGQQPDFCAQVPSLGLCREGTALRPCRQQAVGGAAPTEDKPEDGAGP